MHRYPDSIALDIAHGHSDQFANSVTVGIAICITITATNGGTHGATDVHWILRTGSTRVYPHQAIGLS
jgi:hypothetical protein